MRFWKKDCMQKNNFWSILLLENDINCFIRASWKNMILKWESYSESDFEVKFYNVSDFQLNFWNVSEIEKKFALRNSRFELCYPVKLTFLHFSCRWEILDFEMALLRCATFWNKILQRVRFWIKHFQTCQKLKKSLN